jgi:hypothetical protein
MRSMTIVFLAAAAMAATSGCGRKTTDEFAPAIDDSLSLVVVNRLGVYATVYWQYDGWGRRELDRRARPGSHLPGRMAINPTADGYQVRHTNGQNDRVADTTAWRQPRVVAAVSPGAATAHSAAPAIQSSYAARSPFRYAMNASTARCSSSVSCSLRRAASRNVALRDDFGLPAVT